MASLIIRGGIIAKPVKEARIIASRYFTIDMDEWPKTKQLRRGSTATLNPPQTT
jgi:hypothetical protein